MRDSHEVAKELQKTARQVAMPLQFECEGVAAALQRRTSDQTGWQLKSAITLHSSQSRDALDEPGKYRLFKLNEQRTTALIEFLGNKKVFEKLVTEESVSEVLYA